MSGTERFARQIVQDATVERSLEAIGVAILLGRKNG
jgi:hypothetical protein